MSYHIINIHLSELLSAKIKKSRINECKKKKKKVLYHNKKNGQFTFYT